MAKFDKEMLKKHHFWVLLVPVLIALMIAWCGLVFSLPDDINAKKDEHKKKSDALKGVKAQPRNMAQLHQQHTVELTKQREKMWEEAWNRQKDIFVFPAGYSSNQLKEFDHYKFGDQVTLTNSTRYQFAAPEVYFAEYTKLIKDLEPMTFRDDWTKVVRHVSQWPLKSSSEDIALAMEDLWVQRDILMGIHKVNTNAAKFERIAFLTPDKKERADDKRHRRFKSRIWELELKIVDKGSDMEIQGSLKNISNTLQVTGVNNKMKLNVWFNKDEKAPHEIEVEGVSVEPEQSLEIKPIRKKTGMEKDINVIHPGETDFGKMELYAVTQQFDLRTVPVKRIEHLALGKLADRVSTFPLQMATFSTKPEAKKEEPKNTQFGGTPGGALGKGPPGAPMGMTGMGAMGNAFAGGGFMGQTGNSGSKDASDSKTANGLERLRYFHVTPYVRRLPYAVSVVTDQTYLKDILESLANTKLRFQTMQVDLSKFHGTLNYGNTSASGDDRGTVVTSNREDQFSANLLELSVYGIMSIYERFPDQKGKQGESTKNQTQPGKKDPKTAIEAGPMPKTGKETAPKSPMPMPVIPKDPMDPKAPVTPNASVPKK